VNELKQVQSLLYRLITAPSGAADGLASEQNPPQGGLEAVVGGDDRVSAIDRVEIYANMYFYRLLEVLKEDYPATSAVLGEINFHNLVTGYLIDYPPTEPSVFWAGRYLPDYLRDHPLAAEFPFAPDLAMVERKIIEIFCAADATLLDVDTMRAIPAERWPSLRMKLAPAAALLDERWKVGDILRAVEAGRGWERPVHGALKMLIWRSKSRVHHRELEKTEAAALQRLQRGATFGRVCGTIASSVTADRAAAEINRLLERWLSDQVLVLVPRRSD